MRYVSSPFTRRRVLGAAAGAASPATALRFAWGQAYPSRIVHIIVGFGAGGAPDIFARLIGQWLSERLGQQFIVENRPGASGNIATEAVVRAPPDGHTLLLVATPSAVNATLYDNLGYDFSRDIAPVAGISREPLGMELYPPFPARSVPDFIAYAKANPGKISYASAGNGSSLHLAAELFKIMAGVEMVHVPYRSSAAALVDLLGGQVQMMFCPLPSSIEYVRNGKLRVLATTGAVRASALPDAPIVADFLPGYEVSAWYGVCAPRNTRIEVIDKLNQEINAGLADPKIAARLAQLGSSPFAVTPADFGKHIAEQTEKWRTVIKAAHIKPD
ncbi:MAG: tripartite tricarboxylate transporter substrate binding protein [Alphaproteobacteria bacterium]|nr:tripartite tricarboxylate transporter substrate binding protein [Alphaproteobacteria bacterium]MBV8411671.1 tripartite tricarboxylate transporter substrate binding protein [Alphaproteobacteria bacterium]